MHRYILQRILTTIPVMGVVALIVFFLMRLSVGDPALIMAGDGATEAQLEQMRKQMGIDRPIPIQFMNWVGQMLSGDFGISLHSRVPVTEVIANRVGPSLSLSVLTILFSVSVAIPIGLLAAWSHGSLLDRLVMSFSVLGFSTPVFVIAYALVFTFSVKAGWFPIQGYRPIANGIGAWFVSLVLPMLSLATVNIALVARITRSSILEVLGEEYIRTARSKGLRESRVFLRHALRNAAVPIVTIVGIGAAFLMSGVVVTESVFNIPGLGRLVLEAVLARDYPLIQALILLFSAIYIFINLVVDLLYTVFDPRIRY